MCEICNIYICTRGRGVIEGDQWSADNVRNHICNRSEIDGEVSLQEKSNDELSVHGEVVFIQYEGIIVHAAIVEDRYSYQQTIRLDGINSCYLLEQAISLSWQHGVMFEGINTFTFVLNSCLSFGAHSRTCTPIRTCFNHPLCTRTHHAPLHTMQAQGMRVQSHWTLSSSQESVM